MPCSPAGDSFAGSGGSGSRRGRGVDRRARRRAVHRSRHERGDAHRSGHLRRRADPPLELRRPRRTRDPTVVNISAGRSAVSGQRRMPQLQIPPALPSSPSFESSSSATSKTRRRGPRRSGAPRWARLHRRPAGLIVTNHHVVRETDEITVTLHDAGASAGGASRRRREYGPGPALDRRGRPAALCRVRRLRCGPGRRLGDRGRKSFGLGGTVTAGIVSARSRDIRSGPLDDFLQIDAPINRGNSGGPLFDTSGRVVGVNTAIFSPSGGSVGIGFAIPARQAQEVIDDLATTGRVERGWMGVQIQMLTARHREEPRPRRGGGCAGGRRVRGQPRGGGGRADRRRDTRVRRRGGPLVSPSAPPGRAGGDRRKGGGGGLARRPTRVPSPGGRPASRRRGARELAAGRRER